MTSIYLSDTSYARLRERYEQWQQTGYPQIDAGIQPLLERLNAYPGVVTVSSCVGHRETTRKPKSPFYVQLGCTAEGWLYLRRIYEALATRLVEISRIYQDGIANGWASREFVQIQAKEFQLQLGFRDLVLSEQEVLTYHCYCLIAKGAHYAPVRLNFFKEFFIVLDGIATAKEST